MTATVTRRPLAPAEPAPPTVAAWRAQQHALAQAQARAAAAEHAFIAAWRERRAARRELRVIEQHAP